MQQMVLINLPSSDIARSRTYYAGLGYAFDERFCGPDSLLVGVSETIHLMLLSREKFAHHSPRPVAPEGTVGALISLSMDGREAVDAWISRAVANGGVATDEVEEQGDFMYGRSAFDPDGNGIQAMWMDVDAAMRAWGQAA